MPPASSSPDGGSAASLGNGLYLAEEAGRAGGEGEEIFESLCVLEGVETLVVSVFIAGFLLMLVGYARLARLVQLIPASVMIGFCNGIAVILFLSQLQIFRDLSTGEFVTGARAAWMSGECVLAAIIMEGWKKVPWVRLVWIPACPPHVSVCLE